MLKLIKRLLKIPQSNFTNKNSNYSGFDIGEWTYGQPQIVSGPSPCGMKIGRFCSIANAVEILLLNDHRSDWVSTYPFAQIFKEAQKIPGYPKIRGDVIIGNDVWIGYGAKILSGVTIGNGAIVGAYAMVAKDVPAYGIVAGNPGKIIRKRFGEDVILELQKIQWWNWPIDKIREAVPLMMSDNIKPFINKYRVQ
jgi:acetyltransferase-like isoleucine patch superfamily enzyme